MWICAVVLDCIFVTNNIRSWHGHSYFVLAALVCFCGGVFWNV